MGFARTATGNGPSGAARCVAIRGANKEGTNMLTRKEAQVVAGMANEIAKLTGTDGAPGAERARLCSALPDYDWGFGFGGAIVPDANGEGRFWSGGGPLLS